MATTSNLFSLNTQDAIKGLVVSVFSAVITVVQNSISNGVVTFNWKEIGTVALAAGLAYLSKNFFTPSTTVISTSGSSSTPKS